MAFFGSSGGKSGDSDNVSNGEQFQCDCSVKGCSCTDWGPLGSGGQGDPERGSLHVVLSREAQVIKYLRPGITVVIPSIPPRRGLLHRAIVSVLDQTMPAAAIAVAIDSDRLGAARTRQRALEMVDTRWVAFLDDDDELKPRHLEALYSAAVDYGAEYVWSRFQVALPRTHGVPLEYAEYDYRDGPEPLGRGTFEQWNPEQPAQTTITTLVSTELARRVGGFMPLGGAGAIDGTVDGQRAGEDWDFTLRCVAAAGPEKLRHVPEVTWIWHHHERNTSGLPTRW